MWTITYRDGEATFVTGPFTTRSVADLAVKSLRQAGVDNVVVDSLDSWHETAEHYGIITAPPAVSAA